MYIAMEMNIKMTAMSSVVVFLYDHNPYHIYGKMGFFTLLLVIIIILAVIGLGWKSFSSGVITGLEKAVDISTPVIKDLTQEAKQYVNSP
jgi:hypothetical protein